MSKVEQARLDNSVDRELKVSMVPLERGCLGIEENLEYFEKDFLAFSFSMTL